MNKVYSILPSVMAGIGNATKPKQAFDQLIRLADLFGMLNVRMGEGTPNAILHNPINLVHDRVGWYDRYVEQEYFPHDPVNEYYLRKKPSFVTWTTMLKNSPVHSIAYAMFMDAAAHGLKDGVVAFLPNYAPDGMCGVSMSGPEGCVENLPQDVFAILIGVAQLASVKEAELRTTPKEISLAQPYLIKLTPKQKAVLFEALQGKTNEEIAAATHCSSKQVEKHLTGIYSTFGVSGKIALLAKAGSLGLPTPVK